MILGRTLTAVTALVILATATGLCIVAASAALFWLLEPLVGRAGAAALLAGVLALVVSVSVLVVAGRGHSPRHRPDVSAAAGLDFAFVDRVIEMAKDRPLLSIGAALAAGLIIVRNPALVATIVAAFMERTKPDR